MKNGRLTREAWTDLGLEILGRTGPEGLTVDALCRATGKTRGSIYHHFRDINALLEGILERWQEKHTDALINDVEAAASHGGLSLMNHLAMALDAGIERSVRQLVARHPRLHPLLAETDRRRVAFLAGLHRRENGFSEHRAAILARIEYAAWVGFQYLESPPDAVTLDDLYHEFNAMVRHFRT